MPYITARERQDLDHEIGALIAKLKDASEDELDGRLNYAIMRLLIALYPPKYFNYSRAMGVLNSVSLEFYRRFVAPYEDEKRSENGDLV